MNDDQVELERGFALAPVYAGSHDRCTTYAGEFGESSRMASSQSARARSSSPSPCHTMARVRYLSDDFGLRNIGRVVRKDLNTPQSLADGVLGIS